jgi:hypothetical protein
MPRRLFVAVFLLLIIAPGTIQACSCVFLSAGCGMALNPGDVVFLGKVISKIEVQEPTTGGDNTGIGRNRYAIHLAITENFESAGPPGQEIVVYTGQGGGDCGYPFLVGTSYLVHASSYNGQLSTSICSGTSPEVMAAGVLRELRAIRDSGRVDDLFGTIGMAPEGAGFEDLAETRPLPNVSVHVTSSKGEVFSTKTDERGAFAFARLPRDTYRIEQDLPAGLSTWQSKSGKPLNVEVDDKTGAGAGCQVDVFSRPDGQISGTVVDVSGKGVPGFVTLQPTDPRAAQVAMRRGGLPGCDTDDGSFSLPQLAPGRYRLVFHPRIGNSVSFRHTFYWPPVSDASNSLAIELGFGQHVDTVRFEVAVTDKAQ